MTHRVIFVSDVHMSNSLPRAQAVEPRGVTDRLRDQTLMWERIREDAQEFGADEIAVLGDLFDKARPDPITLTATVSVISSIAGDVCPVSILGGNHDAVNTRGERFLVECFGEMGNDRIRYLRSGEPVCSKPWLSFWPVEYCPPETAREWLKKIRKRMKGRGHVNVALLHHSIIGCRHGGWTCDDGLEADEVCEGFDWVFSGHFHDPQKFGPDGRGLYLGAPLHLRGDDAGRRAGYWAVKFKEDGRAVRKMIDGGCPRFHEFPWTDSVAVDFPEPAKKGDYVRLVVEATTAEWKARQPLVKERVDALKKAGFRASFRLKPVYHHSVRLERAESPDAYTPEKSVEAYVGRPDVAKSGLDPERLKRVGLEVLSEARRAL